MKILITGGAGFVGSHLAIEFMKNKKDAEVIAFDNLKRRGSELNIPRLKTHGVEFIHGDIRNKEDINAIGKCDVVIECSAEPSVMAGVDSSPEYVLNTNLCGTMNCLEYARKYKADVVFLSTSRVYPAKTINNLHYLETPTRFELLDEQDVAGVSSQGFTENFPLHGARTLYGATKFASELILQEYIDMYGIRGIINRCGVISGSWQMGKIDQGVVVLWVARHIFNKSLQYIGYGGKGKQVRDILHVKDLYRLIGHQIDDMDLHNGEIYNVGGGYERSVSLCELTSLCERYTGNTIEIQEVSADRIGDIRMYVTDNAKVIKKTAWKPEISIDDIIKEIVAWIEEYKEQLWPILS
jgi:CDP-paratose 2-epimerase